MNNKPNSVSCKAYTEVEQDLFKDFLGDFLCKYLTQLEEDISANELLIKHKEAKQNPAYIDRVLKRIGQTRVEKQMLIGSMDFLKQKGAL
jgi:hypothetical protein